MNNLIIKPEKMKIYGTQYNMILNVSAIYYIEEILKKPFFEVIKGLDFKSDDIAKTLTVIIQSLVSESEREGLGKKLIQNAKAEDYYRYFFIVTSIIQKCLIIDKSEEDNIADYVEEEIKEHGEYDFPERMFTIGRILGYNESEIWKTTPRKLCALHRDYIKYNSGDPVRKQAADFL